MARKVQVNAVIETLHTLGREYGVEVSEAAQGHFQLRGGLLVNYYPFSKNLTAYVGGTKQGKQGITPLEAIRMAHEAPPIVPKQARDQRIGKSSRQRREWLLKTKRATQCRWCACSLTIDTSTLEHVIPLARGGLDQANNWTLACYPCNQDRSHDMPELTNASWQASQEAPKEVLAKATKAIAGEELKAETRLDALKRARDLRVAKVFELREMLCLRREGKKVKKGMTVFRLELELSKANLNLKRINSELSEEESKLYNASFREVAKDFIDEKTLHLIEAEAERRRLTTIGDRTDVL